MPRLDALIRARHQLSWSKARDWIATGKVWVDGKCVTDAGLLVDDGKLVELRMNAPRPRTEARLAQTRAEPGFQTVYVDTQLIVISKRAGVSSVPYEPGETGSLQQQVSAQLGHPVTVVHRLDRETSGLLVFARTRDAARGLANQFRFHTILRRYVALAQGEVRSQTIRSALVENRGDGLRGSVRAGERVHPDATQLAVTHVNTLAVLNGMSLIECRLETGRTHQIRIHLSEAGHPLLGEKAYDRDYTGPRIQAPRLMLHAGELGFTHPTRAVPMSWRELPPADFMELVGEGPHARELRRLFRQES